MALAFRFWFAAAVALAVPLAAQPLDQRPTPPLRVVAVNLPLRDVLVGLARQAEVTILLDVNVPGDRTVSAYLDEVTLDRALDLLLGPLDLVHTRNGDVIRITLAAAEPGATPTADDQPDRPRRDLRRAGRAPVVFSRPLPGSSGYTLIRLKYAYAPGIAMLLGGQSVLLSQVEPWRAVANGGLNGGGGIVGLRGNGGGGFNGSFGNRGGLGNGGFGTGLGGGLGGGQGGNQGGFGGGGFGGNGFGAGGLGTGGQGGYGANGGSLGSVFDLPDGIEQIVGLDWLSGLIAR